MGRGRHRRYRHLNIFNVLGVVVRVAWFRFYPQLATGYPILSNNDILLKEVSKSEKTTILVFVSEGDSCMISIATHHSLLTPHHYYLL